MKSRCQLQISMILQRVYSKEVCSLSNNYLTPCTGTISKLICYHYFLHKVSEEKGPHPFPLIHYYAFKSYFFYLFFFARRVCDVIVVLMRRAGKTWSDNVLQQLVVQVGTLHLHAHTHWRLKRIKKSYQLRYTICIRYFR